MGDIVYKAFVEMFGNFMIAVVILPVAAIFIAYVVYTIVMTIKEFKRK